MKKSLFKLISLFLAVALFLSGCTLGGGSSSEPQFPEGKEAQAVLAFNPVFYLNSEAVVAFNDVNSAIVDDAKSKTLTSLSTNTSWKWLSKSDSQWKLRDTYELDVWHNRASVSTGSLKAYSYIQDGTVSLMCYNTNALEVKTYNDDALPESGLLISTSGDRQEGISYIVNEDSTLEIQGGTLTMIKSVGGVETGFLDAEDGSIRTAVVNIMINNEVLWSGEFGKSVGEDGEEVTYLEYPDFYELPVTEGDIISFGIQLNGELAEKLYGDDIETGGSDNTDNFENTDNKIDIIDEEDIIDDKKEETETVVVNYPFVDGYDSRFEVTYSENASIAVQKLANTCYTTMEKVTEAEVKLKSDDTEVWDEAEYEILIGETNRQASKDVYSTLRGYRKNCANDYIVAVSGKHIVIAGGSDVALEEALDFFLTTYLKDDKSSVPSNMYHVSRPTVKTLSIAGADVSNYVIRTEKYPSILTKRAANNLANYFIVNCGIVVPVENDQSTTNNEILVGLTERSGISSETFKSESLDWAKGYDNEQYNVFYNNGKLFLEAGSDYSANYAANLVMQEFDKSGDISASIAKSGVYSTEDDEKYTLSDGYGLAWSDEFLTTDKNGSNVENLLDYWTEEVPAGDATSSTVSYKPDNKLITELLNLDLSDPLRRLLSEKKTDDTYGDYYSFGKMYSPGYGKGYGVKDNMLYQTSTFDVNYGFTRARLETKNTMHFRYGIFEARQIIGAAPGASTSLWFSGAAGLADDGEIDLYENFGGEKLKPNLHTWAQYSTIHTNHGDKDFKRTTMYPEDGEHFYDTFHYIGIEWSADFLDFYLDGEIFCSVPMTDEMWYVFEQKYYPRLSFGVVGGFYTFETTNGTIGSTNGIEELLNYSVTQYTDYVRIFQKNGERQRVWDFVN